MLSQIQLQTMLELQDAMNKKVNPEWLGAGYGYLRAAMIEAVEGIEHHGWKWWKYQEKDIAQLQMELVDIWHFAMSHILISENGNAKKCAETINDDLVSKRRSVLFDTNDYDYSAMELLDNLQLMAGLCAAGRFDVPLFMHIVIQAEMDHDELYRQYVGKNVLNIFRQDHGYKDGSYMKIWHQREDNEHLVEVMSELNINASTFADDIYAGLQKRYPKT